MPNRRSFRSEATSYPYENIETFHRWAQIVHRGNDKGQVDNEARERIRDGISKYRSLLVSIRACLSNKDALTHDATLIENVEHTLQGPVRVGAPETIAYLNSGSFASIRKSLAVTEVLAGC